jgi:hypothetical protein
MTAVMISRSLTWYRYGSTRRSSVRGPRARENDSPRRKAVYRSMITRVSQPSFFSFAGAPIVGGKGDEMNRWPSRVSHWFRRFGVLPPMVSILSKQRIEEGSSRVCFAPDCVRPITERSHWQRLPSHRHHRLSSTTPRYLGACKKPNRPV